MKNIPTMTRSLLALLFLAAVAVQAESNTETVKQKTVAPYPLTVCPVSGETLDADYASIQSEGQEIRFCCNSCKKKFQKNPEKYLPKLAVLRAAAYPLSTCVVSGEKLGEMGDPYVFQHEGTEVRFCCKGCTKKFNAHPEKYLAKIHAAQVLKDKADKQGKPEGKAQKQESGHDEGHDHSGHQH